MDRVQLWAGEERCFSGPPGEVWVHFLGDPSFLEHCFPAMNGEPYVGTYVLI